MTSQHKPTTPIAPEPDWWTNLYQDDQADQDTFTGNTTQPEPAGTPAPDHDTVPDMGPDVDTETTEDSSKDPDDVPWNRKFSSWRRAPHHITWTPPQPEQARQSAADWWRGRPRTQTFPITTAAAAAAGTWGHGLFSGQWDTGIPQYVLHILHDVAADYPDAATVNIVSLLLVLASLIAGSAALNLVLIIPGMDKLARQLDWLLVRIPVTSTVVGVGLYNTA